MSVNSSTIARLNIRDNMIKDAGMLILAKALIHNKSIVHLDIC